MMQDFGLFGKFDEIDLESEIKMIETNIIALHILTKLFLRDMKKRNSGYVLNVSSMASFEPGPLMSTYYATKAYVTSLSRAICKELKKDKSNVKVSVLCPGPVDTNFNNVAGVSFSVKQLTSQYVAKCAVDGLLRGKKIIIPGFFNKCLHVSSKFIPTTVAMEFVYYNQKRKSNKKYKQKK